jgi:hypothetical protein
LAVAIAWIPLLVLAAVHGGFAELRAVLVDYRVYARVLVAIPLLLVAQITMDTRFREMAQHFLDANIVRTDELSRFHQIMQKTRRLRDALLPEILVIVAVYLQVGYLLESGRLRFASWAMEAGSNALTPAGYYSVLISQGIFLVLLGIVAWKWAIWIYVLRRMSQLHLQVDATNGDLTGGLGFLSEVPRAFVPVVLAISAVVGATWRSLVLNGQLTLDGLIWPAAVYAALMLAIFFLPLSLFLPTLVHEKRLGVRRYGSLQHLVSLQFRRKWTQQRNRHVDDDLLSVPDFSALADLSASLKNVEDMVAYPFRKSVAISFLIALALPLIPVVTTQIPLKEILKGLFDALH